MAMAAQEVDTVIIGEFVLFIFSLMSLCGVRGSHWLSTWPYGKPIRAGQEEDEEAEVCLGASEASHREKIMRIGADDIDVITLLIHTQETAHLHSSSRTSSTATSHTTLADMTTDCSTGSSKHNPTS